MRVADLQRLYDYTYWANTRLFQAMSKLPPEQFTQSVAGSYGSIRNTLVHVMSAEWGWLDRAGGKARGPRLKAEDYPTLDSVVSRWASVEAFVREFLASLSDADLARTVEYSFDPATKHTSTVGRVLQHGAIHGVHHRGQVAMLLRMLGYVPGNFDLVYYDEERRLT